MSMCFVLNKKEWLGDFNARVGKSAFACFGKTFEMRVGSFLS